MRGVSLGFEDGFAIRRLLVMLICSLLEDVPLPFFSALPLLTISTIVAIFLSRAQDREALREWEGKVSKLERLFWRLARDGAPHSIAQLRAVLREVKKDRKTHAKMRMALQQQVARASTEPNDQSDAPTTAQKAVLL